MRIKPYVSAAFILLFLLSSVQAHGAKSGLDSVRSIVDRECVNLRKDVLFFLLRTDFAREIEGGLEPELLKIMEGVIKRTDFDGIPEKKSSEIIRLVYSAYRMGASLEYLDQIFDVAYSKDVSAEQLYSAANALKEFHDSDVPDDIYEEFVYHSMEERWSPVAMPALTKGLIYGVERGLTAQRVALAIIVDVDQGGLKKKSPEALASEAVKFVKGIEPHKWRPTEGSQKKAEHKKEVDRLKREAEAAKMKQDDLDRQRAEMEAKAGLDDVRRKREFQERVLREIEEIKRRSSEMAAIYRQTQRQIDRNAEMEAEEEEKSRRKKRAQREERRKKELAAIEERIEEYGRQGGSFDNGRLYAAVDRYLGIPYRFGGDSEDGMDCSAFTRRVYREVGVELPRTARAQAGVGSSVAGESFQPGDLVFFDTSIMGAITHVGVYLDSSTFAHASKSRGIIKSSIRERYYYKRYVKAARVFNQ